jgi:hypothetical protein
MAILAVIDGSEACVTLPEHLIDFQVAKPEPSSYFGNAEEHSELHPGYSQLERQ